MNIPTRMPNYDIPVEWWRFNRREPGTDIEQYRRYEFFQVETTLRERDHAATSSVDYLIGQNGQIYNSLLPDEPFGTILERGVAYRKKHGSQETQREQSELEGWRKICAHLSDDATPLHSKAVVISPPGLVDGTSYHDNFVDIYETMQDPVSGRYIKMTRFASQLDYDRYYDRLKKFDPNYFQETNKPIDAWILSHPIFIDPQTDPRSTDEIFDQVFEKRKGAMKESDFQELIETCLPVILHFIDRFCEADLNGDGDSKIRDLALSWNAILAKNDRVKDALQGEINDIHVLDGSSEGPPKFASIQAEVDWYGNQDIKKIEAGCGDSGGLKVRPDGMPMSPIEKIMSNSAAKYGLKNSKNQKEWFVCPSCDYHADGPVGDTCPGCGLTKDKHAAKGGKVC